MRDSDHQCRCEKAKRQSYPSPDALSLDVPRRAARESPLKGSCDKAAAFPPRDPRRVRDARLPRIGGIDVTLRPDGRLTHKVSLIRGALPHSMDPNRPTSRAVQWPPVLGPFPCTAS